VINCVRDDIGYLISDLISFNAFLIVTSNVHDIIN